MVKFLNLTGQLFSVARNYVRFACCFVVENMDFIKSVNDAIKLENPGKSLSRIQCYWLSFCITAIILTNSVCWIRFEKISLGRFKASSLSWMFRLGKICWERLLICSIRVLLKKYGIHQATLVLDDSERARSKNTKRIAYTHKQKNKKTGGYVMGQSIVLLLLVTPKITFYQPDPAIKAWVKQNKRLKSTGVLKKDSPKTPPRDRDLIVIKTIWWQFCWNSRSMYSGRCTIRQ